MRIVFPDGRPWFIKAGRPKNGDELRKGLSREFSRQLLEMTRSGSTFQELADKYEVHVRTIWWRVQNAIDAEGEAI